MDVSGKKAVIFGGTSGIGLAAAKQLATLGANVIAISRNPDRAGDLPDGVTTMQCDVTDRLQVQQVVEQIHERHGQIDVLVNNAGIHRRVDPVDWEQTDLDALLSVNLLGSFYMATTVGRVMVERRAGSIINMSALGGGLAGLGRAGSMYGMTKGGIVSLTRDLAAEWGKYSIRVNALAPGWIRTPMTNALQQNPERAAKVLERVPLGRWGEPQDVAGAALFLASDASRYITGHTIPIDGGATNVIALSE